MISILNFKYLGSGLIAVTFSDCTEGTFDLNSYLSSRHGPLLLPLQDERYVNLAFIDAGALAWPNGLEISPQRIYELVQPIQRAA